MLARETEIKRPRDREGPEERREQSKVIMQECSDNYRRTMFR